MEYKGRRLKRFFGLIRKKGLNYHYSIENVLPNKITGWAASEDLKLDEIKLFVGENFIAKTKLDIFREDVSNSINIDGNHGFELLLPENITPIDKNSKIKIIISTNKNEINLTMGKKINNFNGNFSDYLYTLFQSDFLNAQGHFDGVSHDDLLIGWAGKPNSKNPLSIWLQSNDLNPIKVDCNNYRFDKNLKFASNYNEFQVYIHDLPNEWKGKSVFCSFDKEGLFRLPQDGKVYIKPYEQKTKVSVNKQEKKKINSQILPFNLEKPRNDLKNYKELFEEFHDKFELYEKNRKRFNLIPFLRNLKNIFYRS